MREAALADLADGLLKRIKIAQSNNQEFLIEKDVVYAPYLQLICEAIESHIVFVHRDPFDVVESWTGWGDRVFGNAYRDQIPHTYLSQEAANNALTCCTH